MIINPQFIAKRRLHRIDLHKEGENFVLRFKKREEAIKLITMDPKVYGKLLTTHWRGLLDDVEALRG